MSHQRHAVRANDSFKIRYKKWGGSTTDNSSMIKNVCVLLHGWSGNSNYFSQSIQTLKHNEHTVYIAPDLRGHSSTENDDRDDDNDFGKYHISRLAKDLFDLIVALKMENVIPAESLVSLVGTSMGAAVIFSFCELFGEDLVKNIVIVDQAPFQNRREDWQLGSTGCFDDESFKRLRASLFQDMSSFADENEKACIAKGSSFKCDLLIKEATLRCKPEALTELMLDHTNLDWRPLIAQLQRPVLVIVGEKTQIFPWKGVAYCGYLAKNSQTMVCKNCGHWLYLEQPGLFAFALSQFISGEDQPPANESLEADLKGGYEFYKDKFYFIDAKKVDYRFVGGNPEFYKL
jgi:non-heme chloroperoxidase